MWKNRIKNSLNTESKSSLPDVSFREDHRRSISDRQKKSAEQLLSKQRDDDLIEQLLRSRLSKTAQETMKRDLHVPPTKAPLTVRNAAIQPPLRMEKESLPKSDHTQNIDYSELIRAAKRRGTIGRVT